MTAAASGYDPGFLGIPVPLPVASGAGIGFAQLDYRHFSVVQNTVRRLAAVTGVNIDGAELVDLERGDDWHLDPRLPEDEQAGPEIYSKNDLDRGHLVRRRDPTWGEDAAEANIDTFSYTNAAPQVNVFNQSPELWNGLEDYILAFADSSNERLSVFTGPVFAASDPLYRGLQLPRAFWKVAAWSSVGELKATGYVLDQGELLDALRLPSGTPSATAPELGAFRTFQVAIGDIAALAGVDFGSLVAADRIADRAGVVRDEWTVLEKYEDIRL